MNISIISLHRNTTYVDEAYCYRWSSVVVGLSVTIMSPAKTAEPIEMQFGLWKSGGPEKPSIGTIFEGKGWPIVKCMDCLMLAVQND